MLRRVSSCAAAVLMTAAAFAAPLGPIAEPAAAASAGACSDADGVTVVVDFHDLGGGLQQTCDTNGGGLDGASLFARAGYELTPVQRQPAFVCRVNGVPADDPCVNTPPADAYWTLWWSDGTDGRWSYSSVAASSLKIPDGGYVAFSWNRGSGQDKPGTTPKARAGTSPTSTPKPTPSPKPSASPTPRPTPTTAAPTTAPPSSEGPTPSPSPSPTKSTKPTKKPKPSPSSTDQPTPTDLPSDEATEEEVVGTGTSTGDAAPVPTWAVLLVVGGLFAGATGIAVARRRRHGSALGP